MASHGVPIIAIYMRLCFYRAGLLRTILRARVLCLFQVTVPMGIVRKHSLFPTQWGAKKSVGVSTPPEVVVGMPVNLHMFVTEKLVHRHVAKHIQATIIPQNNQPPTVPHLTPSTKVD